MGDEFSTLAAALPANQTVVRLTAPLPVRSGYLIVSPGLAVEERMRIVSVDESGLLITVERENPQPHMLLTYARADPAADWELMHDEYDLWATHKLCGWEIENLPDSPTLTDLLRSIEGHVCPEPIKP